MSAVAPPARAAAADCVGNDASPTRYLRRLSLDLRGAPPTLLWPSINGSEMLLGGRLVVVPPRGQSLTVDNRPCCPFWCSISKPAGAATAPSCGPS